MQDGVAFHTPDYDGSAPLVCRRLALPSFLWSLFNGAFGELLEESNWHQFGDMPISDVVQAFQNAFDEMEPCSMIGQIIPFCSYDAIPENCILCVGSVHLVDDYPELALLLPSNLVHGDTFSVPDLRGRFLLGQSLQSQYLSGETGGEETHTLTVDEMPTHTHEYTTALPSVSTVVVPDEPSAVPSPSTTTPSGGNQPHNNMPPYFVVVYAIVAK